MGEIIYREKYTITFGRSPNYGDLEGGSWGCMASCESLGVKEYGDTREEALQACKVEIDKTIEREANQ